MFVQAGVGITVTRRSAGRWESVDRAEGSEGENFDVPLPHPDDFFDESPPPEDQIDYISSTGSLLLT